MHLFTRGEQRVVAAPVQPVKHVQALVVHV